MFKLLSLRSLAPLAVALLAAVAGCSGKVPQKVSLNGTVTFKGEPVPGVMVRFIGSNGEFATAVVAENGTFSVTDVPLGEVKVGFTQTPQNSGSSGGPAPGAAPKKAPPVLPPQYGDPATSGLSYTITREMRELKIEIK